MTGARSRREHAAPHRPLRERLFERTRGSLSAWSGRRTAVVSSSVALTLVAGLAFAATIQSEPRPQGSELAALGLEIDPDRTDAPTVSVPEDAEWTLEPTDAEASVDKADVPNLREVQAASRAAERRELEAAVAAEEQAAAQARAAEQAQAAEQQAQAAEQAPAQPPAQERSAAPQAPAVNAAAGSERGALAAMLNNYRASNGVHTLARDPRLDQVAQAWAQWMASNQVLQHNPNYRSEIGAGWSAAGENIVRNTGGASMSADTIVSWMFGWWQNSAPHRKNMLNTRYTHVGIGYVMGPGGPYAVQLFGGR